MDTHQKVNTILAPIKTRSFKKTALLMGKSIEIHLTKVVLHVETHFWGPELLKSMTSIPMAYRPLPLQSLGSIHSSLGNSIHNPSSVASMGVSNHVLRVFKALIVVHSTLQNSSTDKNTPTFEKGVEELRFWMETIVHDCKYGKEGERGQTSHV